MARFKTLRQKEKRYIFDFLGNRQDPKPAAAVFARFPQTGENFIPKPKAALFDGIDKKKFVAGDEKEQDKFLSSFLEHIATEITSVDYEYFIRECVDRFEDFESDGKVISTVDDFFTLNIEMRSLIADDCYKYAMKKDEFTMGE